MPKGLSSLSAKECGMCHKKHYEEWKLSTHAHAWTDLQFQAELKKETSPFMCINCHIPLQNQQEFIVEGLIDGDIYKPVKKQFFDKNLRAEGITCAGCHVRHNAVIGTKGTNRAPHKTIVDKEFLSEKLCISCHNASAVITPALVCSFETGAEWENGPYFGKKNCISCHMPLVNREMVESFGSKLGRHHFFPGSGIPKLSTVKTEKLDGLSIYPSKLKSSYSTKDSISFSLKVKNEFAGHRLPTGDPERFFLIEFVLKDENGTILSSKTERIGEKWEWHPIAKKIGDNNLNPKEERVYTFSYIPNKKGILDLLVKIRKHRLDEKYATYNKLGDEYPLFINVYENMFSTNVM